MMGAIPEGYVYLDWAATTPLCEEAASAMAPYMQGGRDSILVNANANSLHAVGRAAFSAMEAARREIATCLGASRPSEIVFTSGATEADNTAIISIGQAAARLAKMRRAGDYVPHLITTQIEHDAVLMPAKRLESLGWRVTYLHPNRQGFIEPEQLASALDDSTVLVSVQMANSEMGAVQPIAELAKMAHAQGALFHTDAVQALGKVPVDLRALDVDAASFSAHKICGPKGIGALYLKARTPFEEYQLGGGQEDGRRSGTQNVCAEVGFAAACSWARAHVEEESSRLRGLRDYLYEQLDAIPRVTRTVDVARGSLDYLPNIVHVLVDGLESETTVLRLDAQGVAVSGGSACSSHSLAASHVLRAMGISSDRALGALRLSMGRYTTKNDVETFLAALAKCLDWSKR